VGLLFRGAVAAAMVVNTGSKELFTRVIARLLYRVVGSRRRIALRNIQRAFADKFTPVEREAIAREAYRNAVDTVVEGFSLFAHGGLENFVANIRINGLERLKGAMAGGQGAILITGHYGPFPFMGPALAANGIPGMGFLYRRPKNTAVAGRFDDWIQMGGFRNIADHPRIEAANKVLRELSSGSAICILIDQHFPAGVAVPFFGHPAKTGVGAAVMAARSGAPLVPVRIRTVREPGFKYLIEIDEPFPPPLSNSDEDLKSCMAALTRRIEAWVAEDPRQWFWVHRRWKDLDRDGSGGAVQPGS